MKHVAALLMAVLGGNAHPTDKDVKKILSAGGIEADAEKLKLLMSQVEGKDIAELIKLGRTKLQAVPSGGAAPAAAAPKAGEAAAAVEPEAEEEEEEEDMGFSLFD